MAWYWISLITLCIWWVIGIVFVCIVDSKNLSDDCFVVFCMGLLFPIAWILFYPVRAWHNYKPWKEDYKKNNISFIKYLFGERINKINKNE